MKFGLNSAQLEFIYDLVVNPLQKNGATVWRYGSWARDDHSPFSDLDIMIESKQDLSSEIRLISEQLQNSNFPFKVDLVELKDFAESYRPSYEKDKRRF